MERTAVISKCKQFRYRLGRRWTDGPTCVYVMLNPSTADHEQDDATTRRCIGFAQQEGYGALEVVNLFAFRTPYPSALKHSGFPVGPENDAHIFEAFKRAERVCVAWGALQESAAEERVQVVMPMVWSSGMAPYCMTITRSGFPGHPVRLAKATRMRPFTLEAIAAAMEGREPPATDAAAPELAKAVLNPQAAWPFPVSAHQENS